MTDDTLIHIKQLLRESDGGSELEECASAIDAGSNVRCWLLRGQRASKMLGIYECRLDTARTMGRPIMPGIDSVVVALGKSSVQEPERLISIHWVTTTDSVFLIFTDDAGDKLFGVIKTKNRDQHSAYGSTTDVNVERNQGASYASSMSVDASKRRSNNFVSVTAASLAMRWSHL